MPIAMAAARNRGAPHQLTPGRLHAIVAVIGIAFGLTSPLTAVFATALGAGGLLAGLAVSSANVSILLIDVFGTRWTPRLEARSTLTIALTIFGAGSLATVVAGSYTTMVAARVLQGVGLALFLGVGPQLAMRLAGDGPAGRPLGSFNAAWFTGVALGPLAGGWISGLVPGVNGLRLAFLACGVLSGLIAVLVWTTIPVTRSGRVPRLGLPTLRRIGGRRAHTVLLIGGMGQAVRSGIAMTMIPLFGSQVLGLSTLQVGIALSCLAVTDVLAMGVAARISDTYGRLPVLLAACVWGVAALTALRAVHAGAWFLLLCTAIGLTVGITWVVPGAMAVDVVADPETALAAHRIASDLGLLAGGIASGAAIAAVATPGALVAGGVHLLLIGAIAAAVRETRGRARRAITVPAIDVPPLIGISPSTLPGGSFMSSESDTTHPTPELFDAMVADQGLEFLSTERRRAALETHSAMRPALAKLRAVPLNFLEPVSEPASALAWLESGGVRK